MKFEILLSTMYRTNLEFLDNIFKHNILEDFNLLIINQTTPNKLLKSDSSKIRVINSFEKGVSASRNLSIKEALGQICLFADDDIIYKPNLKEKILNEFNLFPDAYLLNFETVSETGIPHSNYPNRGLLSKKYFISIHMIGMAFRKDMLIENSVYFHPLFSYGGKFQKGDELVFLRNAYAKGLKAYNTGVIIVEHPSESSGKNLASDVVIYAYGARNNHFYGSFLSKIILIKYIYFLYRKKLITFTEIKAKFYIGLKGIKEYNVLVKKGLTERQK